MNDEKDKKLTEKISLSLGLPQGEIYKERRADMAKKIGTLALAGLVTLGVVHEINSNNLNYSPASHIVVLHDGEGLEAVAKTVAGYENVDIRDVEGYIKDMPVNQMAMENGLQNGEEVIAPNSVSQG